MLLDEVARTRRGVVLLLGPFGDAEVHVVVQVEADALLVEGLCDAAGLEVEAE